MEIFRHEIYTETMGDYCVKLSNEKPIAVIMGGKYDGKKVSIIKKNQEPQEYDEEDEGDDDDELDPLEQLDISEFIQGRKLMPIQERMRIIEMLRKKKPTQLTEKYRDVCQKSIKLDVGQYVICPTRETERVFIAGRAGVGKSSFASMYAREYHEMFPKNKMYMISTHAQEKAYEPFDMVHITLDDTFVESPPTLDDMENSLVIFDDTDNLTDKKLQDAVKRVNSNLIANGRKYGTHVLTLAHQLMDYSRTRHLLIEANRVVFFLGGSAYHNKRFLKEYAGMDKNQSQKILGLRSRWVCLGLTIPNYFISENEVSLL
jgi:hypothetical protein